jgi:hypothetical protein
MAAVDGNVPRSSSTPNDSSDSSRVRHFGRWVAPGGALAIAILVGVFVYIHEPQPQALPHKPPNPALLANYEKVPTGWAGHPRWFLGGAKRPYRWQVDWGTGIFMHSQTDFSSAIQFR